MTMVDEQRSLEQRVTDLEVQAIDTGRVAAVALDARAAHQQNIAILNAVQQTQSEHTRTLAGHTQRLSNLETKVDQLGTSVDQIDGVLGGIAAGVHDITLMLGVLIERDAGTA
jgi:hypothetical protein